jgi:hypothetical protein
MRGSHLVASSVLALLGLTMSAGPALRLKSCSPLSYGVGSATDHRHQQWNPQHR